MVSTADFRKAVRVYETELYEKEIPINTDSSMQHMQVCLLFYPAKRNSPSLLMTIFIFLSIFIEHSSLTQNDYYFYYSDGSSISFLFIS